MKNIICISILICLGYFSTQAQEIRINGYTNYVFDDRFESINNTNSYLTGRINGGFQWGVGLEYKPAPPMGVEISYIRQDTEVPVSYYRIVEVNRRLDASVNYIMLGGNRYAGNEKVEGYGGVMAGTVIYDNKNPQPDEPNSITKFAWGLKLGANVWATEQVGLKIQTQLLSGVQAFGGGFYFGSGGTGVGASTFSTLFQFSLGGGLVFRFEQ